MVKAWKLRTDAAKSHLPPLFIATPPKKKVAVLSQHRYERGSNLIASSIARSAVCGVGACDLPSQTHLIKALLVTINKKIYSICCSSNSQRKIQGGERRERREGRKEGMRNYFHVANRNQTTPQNSHNAVKEDLLVSPALPRCNKPTVQFREVVLTPPLTKTRPGEREIPSVARKREPPTNTFTETTAPNE